MLIWLQAKIYCLFAIFCTIIDKALTMSLKMALPAMMPAHCKLISRLGKALWVLEFVRYKVFNKGTGYTRKGR